MVNLKKLFNGIIMLNIAILCSGGDDMPKKSEKPHLFLDNDGLDVKHHRQRRK